MMPSVNPSTSLNTTTTFIGAKTGATTKEKEAAYDVQLLEPEDTYNKPSRTPLRQHVQIAAEQYFQELEGQLPTNLYQTFLQEVEMPLIQVVLEHTQGNQSKTAKILGLNRGTLRKKMQQYDLL